MKYIVALGVEEFEFEDGSTAMAFAELAVKNFKPTKYCKELKPYIMIVKGGDE